ncbi:hypothetical protein [Streptomyces sp. NPDC001401]|uniref:hypothetical protein n=1 Tax=Streptomyces sp. NPDC001401 TaxID=3364570 RepID=UPI0036976E6C
MSEPDDLVLLFAADCHMWWAGDVALGEEQIESPEDFAYGYDGRGRPLRLAWVEGVPRLELASAASQEAALRQHVRAYYLRYSRLGLEPPSEDDLATFVAAVADDRIDE